MLVLDRQGVEQDIFVQIRPHPPTHITSSTDLDLLGVHPLEQSRVIHIQSNVAIDPAWLTDLIDPLTETISIQHDANGAHYVDVFCRSGVTDAEGEMVSRALSLAGAPEMHCRAGTRTRFSHPVPSELRGTVERLLGNPLIHQFIWHDGRSEGNISGVEPGEASTEPYSGSASIIQHIPLDSTSDNDLLALSRRLGLALDLDEMVAIRGYFLSLARPPTDVELQSISLTWSEHCSHKTFKATISFDHEGRVEIIHGLLKDCIAAPTQALNRPWVRSAFVDNAGVIAFDDRYDLAFKVETHNHPSALEPYGGAHTGVGGVIRDVLAVSAEPIANTDVLCFGPPDLPENEVPQGAFHPARTYREVVRGVADYGNNMGIPTVGGAVLFHRGYTANPLVFCGTLGIVPRDSHPREPRPGDLIVLLGGRTGRDGLHGATMSSETLDRETVAASTVQIGSPITEKVLRDVLPHLRDERLYSAITDCGAGGLCSAVGEMGESLGVDVDLQTVPLKYQGLLPWEIWLSEAQERIVLAVPEDTLPRLLNICASFDLDATSIGRFRDDGVLRLNYGDVPVADIAMSFMHGGRPVRTLNAHWNAPHSLPYHAGTPRDAATSLLTLLAHPNIASKENVIRRYDHEVGGATVVKPLTGNGGPSDAAVLQPRADSMGGAVVAHGINPLYGEHDPYAMAMLAVDEALRNLVAVGGSLDNAALLDNFCWGDVDHPEELGSLVRAAQGCRDAALHYGVPFICGKDSLRNTSVDGKGKHSIPGTLLISAIGTIPNIQQTVTMDLKRSGSALYVLGRTTHSLGGSHYLEVAGGVGGHVPQVNPEETCCLMRRLTNAIRRGLILSCHDLSEGGLAVSAAEMSLAGQLGMDLDLQRVDATTDAPEALLFAESPGRFMVEVDEEMITGFEDVMRDAPHSRVGRTTDDRQFVLRLGETLLVDVAVSDIDAAWKGRPIDPHDTTVSAAVPPIATPVFPQAVHSKSPMPAGPTVRMHPRALILTAAGVNCDRETVEACRMAGADAQPVHLNRLIEGDVHLQDFGMLVIPGGFSYGDHLGAGAMLASVLRHRFLDGVTAFVADGRPVLGICNGFQVLARLGLLGDVSLVPNTSSRFECRWVQLSVQPSPCIFLKNLQSFQLPVAHGEGRLVTPDLADVLARAPLRYVENPNGSVADIAGVCNAAGNVFGLMPHPERYVTPFQHPGRQMSEPAGLVLFQNSVRYIQEEL